MKNSPTVTLSVSPSSSEAAADFGQQGFYLERLADQSRGVQRGSPLPAGNWDSRRDDDWDGGENTDALALLEEPPAIRFAAWGEHVQQDEVGNGTIGQTIQRLVTVLSREDLEPLLSQSRGQSLTLNLIVFDY